MDNVCDYSLRERRISLDLPAINRGLWSMPQDCHRLQALVLPSLVHLFQETIQPPNQRESPLNNQSAYYRKIRAFRQECMKQEAPASGTRSQLKDTGLILFVNTGPCWAEKLFRRMPFLNTWYQNLIPKETPLPRSNWVCWDQDRPMKESD
ncbi:hypothetical protein DPEC_G00198580 [Dallia pectoralis]|uniref:Uncharacterized protein n=1 Tax=Dallia pectoralis TaxID=75939 RepID=A0ACC2G8K0_DALPE|nr:hypothetical protein DPEC_G00198580 [Dallia pectoralis]